MKHINAVFIDVDLTLSPMLDNDLLKKIEKIQTICHNKKIAFVVVSTKDRNKTITHLESIRLPYDYIFSCDTPIDLLIDSVCSFYSINNTLILDKDALSSDYVLTILIEATHNDILYKIDEPVFNIIRPNIKKDRKKAKSDMSFAIDDISSCNVSSTEDDTVDFTRYRLYRQNIETVTHNPEQINYNKFTDIELKTGRYSVLIGGARFEIFLKTSSSEYLYVFLSGAHMGGPHFHRWSWGQFSNSNALCIDDPMHFLFEDLKMGWFLGVPGQNYAYYTSVLIKSVASKLNIPYENIILYGDSAGGAASILISQYIENCFSVSINPQILPQPDNLKNEFEKITKIALEDYGSNANCYNILFKNKTNKRLIIVNITSPMDFKQILKISSHFGININYGLTRMENITIWTYEANGTPIIEKGRGPHVSIETKSLFYAIDYLARSLINNKTIDSNLYSIFSELWYEYYESLSSGALGIKNYLEKGSKGILETRCFSELSNNHRWNPDAYEMLSRLYRDGTGCSKDSDLAAHYIRLAFQNKKYVYTIEAFDLLSSKNNDTSFIIPTLESMSSSGDVAATLRLARLYRRGGCCTNRDLEKAFLYYELAISQGPVKTGCEYAEALFENNYNTEAFDILNNLIKLKIPEAYELMGKIYYEGLYTPIDFEKSLGWYQKAFESGLARTKNQIAIVKHLSQLPNEFAQIANIDDYLKISCVPRQIVLGAICDEGSRYWNKIDYINSAKELKVHPGYREGLSFAIYDNFVKVEHGQGCKVSVTVDDTIFEAISFGRDDSSEGKAIFRSGKNEFISRFRGLNLAVFDYNGRMIDFVWCDTCADSTLKIKRCDPSLIYTKSDMPCVH